MNKKRGFGIIEIIIVMAIMGIAGVLSLKKMEEDARDDLTKEIAKEIESINAAALKYINENITSFQKMSNTQNDFVIKVCKPINSELCELNLSVLREKNLLNKANDQIVGVRKSPKVLIRRVTPSGGMMGSPYYDLEVLVVLGPWMRGSNIEELSIKKVVGNGGAIFGAALNDTILGLNGRWELSPLDYPGVQNGSILTYNVLYGSILEQFLPIDGSLPMVGDLNLGRYRINNAQEVQLTGNEGLEKNKNLSTYASNWVFKAAYNVTDYDYNNSSGTVQKPLCQDASETGAEAKILIKSSSMYNEMFGGWDYGEPRPSPWDSAMMRRAARGGWNIYAIDDNNYNGSWKVFIRRFYDGGFIPGEGIAEVYCYYP